MGNNLLLIFLLAVLVLVNCYFTYRRSTDVDETGRKILAALQLIYLVFIGAIFLIGKIVSASGLSKTLNGGGSGSWTGYLIMIGFVLVLFVVLMILKAKIESKVRSEHALRRK